MKPTAKKREPRIKDLKGKMLGKEKASQVKGGPINHPDAVIKRRKS